MKLFKPFKDKTTKERRWNRQICSPSALFSIAFSLISDFPFERVARKTGKDAGNSYSHNKTGCWLNRRKSYLRFQFDRKIMYLLLFAQKQGKRSGKVQLLPSKQISTVNLIDVNWSKSPSSTVYVQNATLLNVAYYFDKMEFTNHKKPAKRKLESCSQDFVLTCRYVSKSSLNRAVLLRK